MVEEIVHPRDLSYKDGVFLVKLARRAVEEKLIRGVEVKPPPETPSYMFKLGMVFTTIETYHQDGKYSLRGCIGFLTPIYSLVEATIRSAIEAAFADPRFPPVRRFELNNLVFEVTILSKPSLIEDKDRFNYPKYIAIGRDGLIIEKGFYKGTLLPTVPVEYCWDEETFLAETCLKAGLEPDCWLKSGVKVYRYEGKAFKEIQPYGEVVERNLVKEYEDKCLKNKS